MQCLEISHQVYWIIFHNALNYRISFQIPFQLNINIIFQEWKNFNNQLFLENFEKINWNQVLELNQDHVNINFENCLLNTVNTLNNSYASLKKAEQKTKKSFNKNHGLQKESKTRLRRKIGSLESTLDVTIIMKIFYSKNINICKQLINFTKGK